MGLLFNLVMATPTKESKRCHVTSGQTPSDKKRNRPERHDSSSRKSLNYSVSASQNDKENSKVTTLKHTLFFYDYFDYFDIFINVYTFVCSRLHQVSRQYCKEKFVLFLRVKSEKVPKNIFGPMPKTKQQCSLLPFTKINRHQTKSGQP